MQTLENQTPQVVSYTYQDNPIKFNIGSNVMINATHMAKPFGKRPIDWLRLPSSTTFLDTLAKVRKSHFDVESKLRNLSLTDLVQVKKGGTNPGTWMHEDVALEFARWLSPEFAIWCNDRIKEILLNKGSNPLPSPSRKYNKQKIETYLTKEENEELKNYCNTYGFKSTYQLIQSVIRSFLKSPDPYLRIKHLDNCMEILEKSRDFYVKFSFDMIRDMKDEKKKRIDAEKKLKEIMKIAVM